MSQNLFYFSRASSYRLFSVWYALWVDLSFVENRLLSCLYLDCWPIALRVSFKYQNCSMLMPASVADRFENKLTNSYDPNNQISNKILYSKPISVIDCLG